MLFDIRGRGRRRSIKAIYLSLAVLMGSGLVLFGIGGSVSGGLFDALGLTNGSSGGGSSSTGLLAKSAKAYQKRITLNPGDARAWALLAKTRYQLAGQGDGYDPNTGQFSAKGKLLLGPAAVAWERYLALKPAHPDPDVASTMVQAYSPSGLDKPDKGVVAAEIVSVARPTSTSYLQLSLYAYSAGQTRKAQLAGQKAIALAPKDQKAQVKAQVDAVKQQATQAAAQSAAGSAGAAAPATGAQ